LWCLLTPRRPRFFLLLAKLAPKCALVEKAQVVPGKKASKAIKLVKQEEKKAAM
jgi:hypothetical protein